MFTYFRSSPALQSGLLRMRAGYEDRITAFLAAEAGTPATPQMRLQAAQLVAMARIPPLRRCEPAWRAPVRRKHSTRSANGSGKRPVLSAQPPN